MDDLGKFLIIRYLVLKKTQRIDRANQKLGQQYANSEYKKVS